MVAVVLCVFILYGEYTMQKAKRDKLVENEQNITIVAETNEKKNTVIINEYQTRFQNEYNTYEIKDGKLYGNGENASGQLGTGEITSKDSYEQEILIAENVIHVDAFAETMIYLNDKSELYGVGDNGSGQLGQPVEEQEGWY